MKPLLIVLFIAGTAKAQNAVLSWSSFSSASGVVSSGNTMVAGSGGETFTGVSSNGNVMLASGFIAGLAGQSFVTSVQEGTTLPAAFELYQNYPNPFNPSTTIRYDVALHSRVTIAIYNLLGQRISLLVNEEKSPGRYTAIWNGKSDEGGHVATGVYFYRIHTESLAGKNQDFVRTKKLLLVK